MKCAPFALLAAFAATTSYALSDYAAWAKANVDGSWTPLTEAALSRSALPDLVPTDIAHFCPGYAARTPDERIQFWVGLLSAVSRPESNFKPEAKYEEKFLDSAGNRVISRGLLQLSIESANQKKYSCQIDRAEDLHDPNVNLPCGVRILSAWVETDGVIATYGSSPARGGGRYWSTLREKNGHLAEIAGFTKALAVCSAAPPVTR